MTTREEGVCCANINFEEKKTRKTRFLMADVEVCVSRVLIHPSIHPSQKKMQLYPIHFS